MSGKAVSRRHESAFESAALQGQVVNGNLCKALVSPAFTLISKETTASFPDISY